jgi:hypothetical protein
MSPEAILQENILKRNKIEKTNSKILHKLPQQEKLNFLWLFYLFLQFSRTHGLLILELHNI